MANGRQQIFLKNRYEDNQQKNFIWAIVERIIAKSSSASSFHAKLSDLYRAVVGTKILLDADTQCPISLKVPSLRRCNDYYQLEKDQIHGDKIRSNAWRFFDAISREYLLTDNLEQQRQTMLSVRPTSDIMLPNDFENSHTAWILEPIHPNSLAPNGLIQFLDVLEDGLISFKYIRGKNRNFTHEELKSVLAGKLFGVDIWFGVAVFSARQIGNSINMPFKGHDVMGVLKLERTETIGLISIHQQGHFDKEGAFSCVVSVPHLDSPYKYRVIVNP